MSEISELKKEVSDVKKLLVLWLMVSGVSSTGIARTLGISKARLSQIAKRPALSKKE